MRFTGAGKACEIVHKIRSGRRFAPASAAARAARVRARLPRLVKLGIPSRGQVVTWRAAEREPAMDGRGPMRYRGTVPLAAGVAAGVADACPRHDDGAPAVRPRRCRLMHGGIEARAADTLLVDRARDFLAARPGRRGHADPPRLPAAVGRTPPSPSRWSRPCSAVAPSSRVGGDGRWTLASQLAAPEPAPTFEEWQRQRAESAGWSRAGRGRRDADPRRAVARPATVSRAGDELGPAAERAPSARRGRAGGARAARRPVVRGGRRRDHRQPAGRRRPHHRDRGGRSCATARCATCTRRW